MRKYLVVGTVVAALALPALAAAKGPSSALITGPSAPRALAMTGDGESPGSLRGSLVNAGGWFAQVFGQTPDPTLKGQPKATLGPRYKAVYVVPGPHGTTSRIVQLIYPYAKPVPLTYMRAGQRVWEGQTTYGGWFRATKSLKQVLVRAGLPARTPA
jgi:hypothetical protein